MKKKRMIVLALQIVLVAVSVVMMLGYVNQRVKPTEVFVYNANFENSNRVIKPTDISKIKVPSDAVTKSFAMKEEDIIGKHVEGIVNKGQFIYKKQLIKKEDMDKFNDIDVRKLRKISLPISYVEAFAGEVKKGDTIDLLYVGQGTKEDKENQSSDKFSYSKVFMNNVLVYSVNSKDGYEYVPHKETDEDTEGTEKLGIITLAVTLEDAEQIQARLNTGEVKFIGRFEGSESYSTLGYVMGEYGKIFSGKAYAETDELEIIEDEFDEIDIKVKKED